MSKYTTEVRFICEQNAGLSDSEGSDSVNDIIAKSRSKIFDFDFPMFDENYRATLETKILKHYYTKEIGFETVGLWKHFLDMRLNEIMPYYNQLYKSETLEFNPFYDFNYSTTSNRKLDHDETTTNHNTRTDNLDEATTGTSLRTDNLNEATTGTSLRTDNLKEENDTNATRTDNLNEDVTSQNTRTDNLAHSDTTNGSMNHTDAYSDTPQGGLNDVDKLNYLTNYRHINESTSETNNGTNTGTVGNSGSANTKNTGTQTNEVTNNKENTGTQNYDTNGSKVNTGTQNFNTTGNKANTGTQDNDGNGTRNIDTTDDYVEHVAGKRNGMTYSKLLQEYRETFLNIDMMIIDELSDLFMNLW